MADWVKRGPVAPGPELEAATVVLVRDADGVLETLMLRRNSKIVFGGMWVFPGGQLEDADRAGLARDDVLGAARCAAAREAQEEAGLAVDPGTLVTLSHWTPPAISPKRFLTWFFVARAPDASVSIDHGEIHDHDWMSPGAALERQGRGEIELAPPTFVTLHRLSQYPDVDSALRDLSGATPERFSTRITRGEQGLVALWHGDAGYAEGSPDRPGARHRLWMLDTGWSYERSD